MELKVHPFMLTTQQHNLIQYFIHTHTHKGKYEKPYILFISYIIQYNSSMFGYELTIFVGLLGRRSWKPKPIFFIIVSCDLLSFHLCQLSCKLYDVVFYSFKNCSLQFPQKTPHALSPSSFHI